MKVSNVLLTASLGFTVLLGAGCKTGNSSENSDSSISASNTPKRDFAIKALTLNGIIGQLNSAAQKACNNASKDSQYDGSEFKKSCFKTVGMTLGSVNLSSPVSLAARTVTIEIVTPLWWMPIIENRESGDYKATSAAWKTTPVFEAAQKIASASYKANESGEAAGLKIAKEGARLLLANTGNISKAVDKAVGNNFLNGKTDYAFVMKQLKEPLSNPELLAGLLPEIKDFYMAQVADIEKSLP